MAQKFPGFGPSNKKSGGGMMGQAQKMQQMQQEMLRMQEEIAAKEYTASSGGGMVTAVVNGGHSLISLEINPEAVDPDDVEMLQDMVIAAVNEALKAAEEDSAEMMSQLTGGLNIPGLT